jgi:hypothetical protein
MYTKILINTELCVLIFTVAASAPQHQNQFSNGVNCTIIKAVAISAIILKRNPTKLTQDTYME